VRGRAWVLGATAAAAGSTIVVEATIPPHAAYPWQALPAFDLVYGFLGCALIVVASKALGHAGVQKPESYYGDDE